MCHSNAKVLIWTAWGFFPRAVVTILEEKGRMVEGVIPMDLLSGVISSRQLLLCAHSGDAGCTHCLSPANRHLIKNLITKDNIITLTQR